MEKLVILLAVAYFITAGLGYLARRTSESQWGVVLIPVLSLIVAGCIYYLGFGVLVTIIALVVCVVVMILGRMGLVIGIGW